MDETGVTQRPDRIIARRGKKQIGAITSQERRSRHHCCSCKCNRQQRAPMFIFPRKKFQDHFIRDGPPGCCGRANGSGWMQEPDFVFFMQHFIKHARPNRDHPVLLTLDNHGSHMSIEVLNLCKENGVVLLSFPPHTSHKLQPLDRAVFGPFKKAVNSACDSWMLNHPGQTMSIYDVPGIVKNAWPASITPSNIMAGFSCTGIEPFNRNIFDASDFSPSQVTDRPAPTNTNATPPPDGLQPVVTGNPSVEHAEDNSAPAQEDPEPSTSGLAPASVEPDSPISSPRSSNTPPATSSQDTTASSTPPQSNSFSPEIVRPFPKAPPPKTVNGVKRRRKSAILTDSPVKALLEAEAMARKQKAPAKKTAKNTAKKTAKNTTKKTIKKTAKKRM